MDMQRANTYFRQPQVVAGYTRAANRIGLWVSEEKIFTRLFKTGDSLIELGCGAGRIAVGLWELGYRHLLGVDLAPEMIAEARRINQALGYGISFHREDARELPYPNASFEGAIFGFNGLMQIPGRGERLKAMREIYRVLAADAYFTFTAHDRDRHWKPSFMKQQKRLWTQVPRPEGLCDFGDMYGEAPEGGHMFIHSAARQEVLEDLKAAGFVHETDVLRADIANEPALVREFSDDTRFWVARKPK